MTDEEKEALAKQVLFDWVTLKDTGLEPGKIFRVVRTVNNISAEVFARALDMMPQELYDIEECRVPFPTMFLACIFIYGIPEWYKVKEPDAYEDGEYQEEDE